MNPILKGFDQSLYRYLGHFGQPKYLALGHNSDGIPSFEEMVDRGKNPTKYTEKLNYDMTYGDAQTIEPDNQSHVGNQSDSTLSRKANNYFRSGGKTIGNDYK